MHKYYRQFITLSGTRQSNSREPLGRVVLEARDAVGRATVYLQGILQGSYRLIFFTRDSGHNLAVDAGLVLVDDKGRFEGKFEFNRNDIMDSRLTIESIEGAAVAAATNTEPLLEGFTKTSYQWRIGLSFPTLTPPTSEETEHPVGPPALVRPPVVKEEEVVIEEEVVVITEAVPPSVYEQSHFEHHHPSPVEELELTEPLSMPMNVVEIQELPPVEVHEPPIQELPPMQELPPVEAQEPTSVQDQAQDMRLQKFFSGRNLVDVFGNEEPKTQWVAASLVDLQNLGLYTDDLKNNPFVTENAQKYRHVLLGRTEGAVSNNYIIGIPDIFSKESVAKAGRDFSVFKPCHTESFSEGGHGYWIKHLN
jgi:hypothetical protein